MRLQNINERRHENGGHGGEGSQTDGGEISRGVDMESH